MISLIQILILNVEDIWDIRLFEVFYFENCLGSTFFSRITAMKGVSRELSILFKVDILLMYEQCT